MERIKALFLADKMCLPILIDAVMGDELKKNKLNRRFSSKVSAYPELYPSTPKNSRLRRYAVRSLLHIFRTQGLKSDAALRRFSEIQEALEESKDLHRVFLVLQV